MYRSDRQHTTHVLDIAWFMLHAIIRTSPCISVLLSDIRRNFARQ